MISPFSRITAIKDCTEALLGAKEIHARKGLKENEQILDHMGSTELAANLFRATQTDEKLRRENLRGKEKANQTHYEVGRKVRQTIAELGGAICRKTCRRRKRALSRLRVSRRSASTANEPE